MTTDWKHAYPIHAARAAHDRRSHVADIIVVAAALGACALYAAYRIGYAQAERASQTPALAIEQCPASDADRDVLEHTWSHKGTIFHRECIVVSRPNYVAPTFSATRPGRAAL